MLVKKNGRTFAANADQVQGFLESVSEEIKKQNVNAIYAIKRSGSNLISFERTDFADNETMMVMVKELQLSGYIVFYNSVEEEKPEGPKTYEHDIALDPVCEEEDES